MPMTGGAMRDTRCRASSNARPISLATRLFMAGRKIRRGRPPNPKARAFRPFCASAVFPGLTVLDQTRPGSGPLRDYILRLIRANAPREPDDGHFTPAP